MKTMRCNILLPPVWTGVYFTTARLLKYVLEDQGIRAEIRETGENIKTGISVLLGWNLVPEGFTLNMPYILYQLEPLCLEHWEEKIRSRIALFKNARAIWDYSPQNLPFLHQYGLDPLVVPLGYHPGMEEIIPEAFPEYDVLFVGFLTDRRKRILEELSNHCCVSVQPRWGKDYSGALSRSKILLNVHQYDVPTPLEQPRIAYALNNHSFVISEYSTDAPYNDLVVCDYGNLTGQTLLYLHNTALRREMNDRMYHSFRAVLMNDIIEHAAMGLITSDA